MDVANPYSSGFNLQGWFLSIPCQSRMDTILTLVGTSCRVDFYLDHALIKAKIDIVNPYSSGFNMQYWEVSIATMPQSRMDTILTVVGTTCRFDLYLYHAPIKAKIAIANPYNISNPYSMQDWPLLIPCLNQGWIQSLQ